MGHPLEFFKGESKSYVFCSVGKKKPYMEDYGDKFRDNANFADLLLYIIERETEDEKWTWKIAKILAKKLRIEDKLRPHKLSYEEYEKEHEKIIKRRKKKKG